MQAGPDPAQIQHLMAVMAPMMLLFGIIGVALYIIPFWFIFKKSGMGAPLSLLMILPIVNIVMLYVLAFSKLEGGACPRSLQAIRRRIHHPAMCLRRPAYPPVQAAPPVYVSPPSDTPLKYCNCRRSLD